MADTRAADNYSHVDVVSGNVVASAHENSEGTKLETSINQANSMLLDLESNYASATEPTSAVDGKVWYDSTNKVSKIYEGASWEGLVKDVVFRSKNLIIDVASNTTVTVSADSMLMIDTVGAVKHVASISDTYDITTDIHAGTEKVSHWYQLWIDSDKTLKMAPDLTGTADTAAAGFLVWPTGTANTDGVKAGDIVYNTTDLTQTTVSVTPAIDGANIALTDDIFAIGETFKIHMLSPTGIGTLKANIGAAYNNAAGNFDDSTYTQIQEEKSYSDASGAFDITGSDLTLYTGIANVKQVNDWTGAGTWWLDDINFAGVFGSGSNNTAPIAMTGILSDTTANYNQALALYDGGIYTRAADQKTMCVIAPNTAIFRIDSSSSISLANAWSVSGSVKLSKKPTFHH